MEWEGPFTVHTLIVFPLFTLVHIGFVFAILPRLLHVEMTILRNLAIAGNISSCLYGWIASMSFVHESGLYTFGETFRLCGYILFLSCVIVANLSFQLYMILRLKHVFHDTIYKLSNIVLYSYYALLVLMHIFGSIASVYFWFDIYDIAIATISITFVLIMCIAIHICYTFSRNLFRLILAQQQEFGKKRGSTLNAHQHVIIGVIVKYTALNAITLFLFALALVSSGIGTLIDVQYGSIIFLWTFGCAITVSTYCVLLSFASMDSLYFSCFGLCDSLMRKFYVFLAEYQMSKKQKVAERSPPSSP